jgi:hypothetical protein
MTVTVQNPVERQVTKTEILTYSFTFRIDRAEDLMVFIGDIQQVNGADYNLDSFGPSGGSITFGSVPNAQTLTMRRATPEDQQTDYQSFDAFPAQSHENALDKLTMRVQEVTGAGFITKVVDGSTWNAEFARIANTGDPQESTDAVNQQSMENYVLNNAPPGPQGPVGVTGAQGDVGPVGFIGVPGVASRWFTVTTVPDSALGIDGDFALNSTNGDYYEKISGSWVVQGNLKGPIGTGTDPNHSALLNLNNDDHPQYFDQARGDARYPLKGAADTISGEWGFTGNTYTFNSGATTSATGTVQVGSSGATGVQRLRLENNIRSIDFRLGIGGSEFGLFDSSAIAWVTRCIPATATVELYGNKAYTVADFSTSDFAPAVHTHNSTQTAVVVSEIRGASTTLQLSDVGKKLDMTSSSSALTVSVPNNTQADFTTAGEVVIAIRQGGSQAVTISPNAGVTVRSYSNRTGARTLAGQFADAALHYRPDVGLNVWDLTGRFI